MTGTREYTRLWLFPDQLDPPSTAADMPREKVLAQDEARTSF